MMYRSVHLAIHEFILVLLRVLSLATKLLIALAVAGIVLPMFDDVSRFSLTVKILALSTKLNGLIEAIVPTSIRGYSLTNWLIIVIGFLLKFPLNYFANGQMARIYRLNRVSGDKLPPSVKPIKADHGFGRGLLRFLRDFFIYRKSKLVRLQNKITKLKAELNKFGRDLVFLSIDVVGSTKMKEQEDHASIAVHFKKYREFVQQILKDNDMLKASWTPDGVMACFKSFPNAFNAARKVIISLHAFNLEHSHFGHDFRVRCGINGGFVLFDEALKMEDIASHAIDVTAHVQKAAPSNTLYVTRHSIEPKEMITHLAPTAERIDGYEVFMWDRSGFSREGSF